MYCGGGKDKRKQVGDWVQSGLDVELDGLCLNNRPALSPGSAHRRATTAARRRLRLTGFFDRRAFQEKSLQFNSAPFFTSLATNARVPARSKRRASSYLDRRVSRPDASACTRIEASPRLKLRRTSDAAFDPVDRDRAFPIQTCSATAARR